MHEVTCILCAIEKGDAQAAEQLLPLVYNELRKLAAAKMAQEKPDQTLQATAWYTMRIFAWWMWKGPALGFARAFLCAAAEAMRRILVERARQSAGRGGEGVAIDIAGSGL